MSLFRRLWRQSRRGRCFGCPASCATHSHIRLSHTPRVVASRIIAQFGASHASPFAFMPAMNIRNISCATTAFCLWALLVFSQQPPTSTPRTSGVMPNDYFHTGAGARYLGRAEGDLITEHLRGNISVLLGSGANIIVLSGEQGKFLVDAGISVSKSKVQAALQEINPAPLKYVVSTHWHWDHTDGNRWMHEA